MGDVMGPDTANTNVSNEDGREGFPVHSNNNHEDGGVDDGSYYFNEGNAKTKTVEKLDVDEADVEEEMKRQWDMLSDEEKAEMLAHQQEDQREEGGNIDDSPESPSSVVPPTDMDHDVDMEDEEGIEAAANHVSSSEGNNQSSEKTEEENADFADID